MMNYNKRKTLIVVGAGPKGIAVAVKAKVLEECGLAVDRVILIEKKGIAAHWSGEFGYTNGEMNLGTSPEKDVVFPLETDVGDEKLNAEIRQRLMHFTWASFLIHTHQYSDWVDRGRHAPNHKMWAQYLQWISKQLAPQVSVVSAEVTEIDLTNDNQSWKLVIRESSDETNQQVLYADRLMLTGPGETRVDFIDKNKNDLPLCVYDLVSFWHALKEESFSASGRLAIIGSGENAASAILALRQKTPNLQIDIISPKGYISSRAEGYYENKMFSSPEKSGWHSLDLSDRREFIDRTDLGVFSVHAMNILSEKLCHRIIPGRVNSLRYDGQEISLDINYRQTISTYKYDKVILATGFDYVATLKSILTDKALKRIESVIAMPLTNQAISLNIKEDLSLKGISPSLHLPMLAGLMQGPGFANLSCLGLLSDRVVTHFSRKMTLMNTKHKNIAFLLEANS